MILSSYLRMKNTPWTLVSSEYRAFWTLQKGLFCNWW